MADLRFRDIFLSSIWRRLSVVSRSVETGLGPAGFVTSPIACVRTGNKVTLKRSTRSQKLIIAWDPRRSSSTALWVDFHSQLSFKTHLTRQAFTSTRNIQQEVRFSLMNFVRCIRYCLRTTSTLCRDAGGTSVVLPCSTELCACTDGLNIPTKNRPVYVIP